MRTKATISKGVPATGFLLLSSCTMADATIPANLRYPEDVLKGKTEDGLLAWAKASKDIWVNICDAIVGATGEDTLGGKVRCAPRGLRRRLQHVGLTRAIKTRGGH